MAGAQVRLLPPSIPYRFFIASSLYHITAWGLLLVSADSVPDFQGGQGFVLAALHALTLGVFVMVAMGASFQILPVVTNQSIARLWPVKLASYLFIPGVGVLIAGFSIGHYMAMIAGGWLVTAGLALYTFTVLGLLTGASGFKVLTMHIRLAFVFLVVLVALGLGMIFGVTPLGHILTTAAHGSLAVYGFMGFFAMGFGAILVPMFALANPASQQRSLFVMAVYGAGLVIGVIGIFTEFYEVALLGASMLLVGSISHVLVMKGLLKKGMKKNLGISFVLIKTSWVLLPVSLAVGIAAISGIPYEATMLIAAYIAIFGWLLTFVLGVQQQIMPFLAAMNISKAGGKPPRLSQLTAGKPLKIHAVCHFSAIVLLGLGIVTELELAIQTGAVIGIVGALAFLWFTIDVYRRMLKTGRDVSTPKSSMPTQERP